MSDVAADPRFGRKAPPKPLRLSWSDERVRAIFWQVLIVGLVVAILFVGGTLFSRRAPQPVEPGG